VTTPSAQLATQAPLGSRLARWRGDMRFSLGIGASAGAALLAGTSLVFRRRRRRPITPQ
jgi:LPXTG-motif cell wall-anchored protein